MAILNLLMLRERLGPDHGARADLVLKVVAPSVAVGRSESS